MVIEMDLKELLNEYNNQTDDNNQYEEANCVAQLLYSAVLVGAGLFGLYIFYRCCCF